MELALIVKYAKLIAGIAVAVVIAGLVALAFEKTYTHGYNVAKAAGDASLSGYKALVAQGDAKAASDAFGRYATDVKRGQVAEAGFINVQTASAGQAEAIKEQIDGVTQPHTQPASLVASQSSSTVTPVYSCVFSRGFVRLWNAAAGIADDSDRALQGASGTGAASDRSSSDATTDSGVSQADILDWFVDYANRAHGTENKLKGVRAALPSQQ
ncbi:hypothetical protein [Paraburkholderia sp.]|uniref:hypothetical protein n=1 Tax=Paraburkholderia sp. TaxID=1926495 RepID=UPI002D3AE22A|nr:hypothetical protein [Paraburkholderia sp.]HZZ04624.1 hypothetical protein [Paraburkholderia sp.]